MGADVKLYAWTRTPVLAAVGFLDHGFRTAALREKNLDGREGCRLGYILRLAGGDEAGKDQTENGRS